MAVSPPSDGAIAIIGIGCRFPGAHGPKAYWKLLVEGRDAIVEAPPDRFDFDGVYDPTPRTPGKVYSRWGGFVEGVDRFDAAFFGISPRDATRMDPQQRHALEVAWESLEDAGLPMGPLRGSRTGVFVGVHASEYESLVEHGAEDLDLSLAIGGSRNGVAGRISYWLGLEGPSLAVDSDRSSSLVAVHLACQSLRTGECALALAGGTNLLLSPRPTFAFSRAGMLARDGRCKFADARADGIARSDGIGLVVLKPLAAAVRDGDRIYAVIRGSAVNHDGGRSGDFMAPSAASQASLLRAACENAGTAPHDVQYVDAHGPGTPVGDPQEIGALASVLQAGRGPARAALHVGSAKTNIGHAEAAAGIASLIKVALSLRHRVLPPSLHFETPNPNASFDGIVVHTTASPWPDATRPLVAGVTSLGATGTNAHVVLAEAPPTPHRDLPPARPEILPLSAASKYSLLALADRVARELRVGDEQEVARIAATAARRRQHFPHRLAVVGASREEWANALAAIVEAGATEVKTTTTPKKIAFVFPGYGSQWIGMGRELLRTEPVFRAAIARCDGAIRAHAGWSLEDELRKEAPESRLNTIEIAQPALVAMAIALTDLWRSWGFEPAAVVGTSMGEVGAAHVAGALGLEDTFRVVCARARLLMRLVGKGATAIVGLAAEQVAAEMAGKESLVGIAATYSQASTLISGDPATIDELVARFTEKHVFARRIAGGDAAAHSPHMDWISPDLATALAGIRPEQTTIPFYSTVTGSVARGTDLDAAYWVKNGRQPIQFATTMAALASAGFDTYLEMSPHPLLVGPTLECARLGGRNAIAVPSLRRGEPERSSLLRSLADLYGFGCEVDWARIHPDASGVADLPSYAWEHRSYWWDESSAPSGATPSLARGRRAAADAPAFVAPVPLSEQLAAAAPAERPGIVASFLRRQLTTVLGISADALEPTRPFRELGLTSIMAVELRGALERSFARPLPATVAWQHPTLELLTAFLVGLDAGPAEASPWEFEEITL